MQSSTITMDQGQAQLPPSVLAHREPTLAEEAMRLELFEIAEREYRIEALECEIASLKGRLFAAEAAAGEQNQQEVEALQSQVQAQTQQAKQIRADIVRQEQALLKLKDYVGELEAGANELGNQRDALQDQRDKMQEECRVLAINNTTLQRKLDSAGTKNAELEKQVKALKKLDPERLKKQVAELKKANAEKQQSIVDLRAQNHRFVKDNKAKALQIEQLDKALQKACDEMNESNAVEPLETHNLGKLGMWDIFGSPELNRYDVLDKTNNVSYGVTIEDGQVIQPKIRAVPKGLQKVLVARSIRYNATEQAISDSQKPLEQ